MELRDYLRGLRRHWLAVVLTTVVGVLVAAGWAAIQTPLYQATASAYIGTPQDAANSLGVGQSQYAQGFVSTFTSYALWRSTAEAALEEAEVDVTPESVMTQIAVENPEGTAILAITATAASPESAEQLANAWVIGLQHTVDSVDGTGAAGSAPMNVFLGDSAQASQVPVYPDWQTALIIGGVVGLGFGIAFALSRTASDRRIRGGDDLDERLGHAVVGTLPLRASEGKRAGRGADTEFAFSEAMRVLRTNLQFMDVDNPPRTIVVTSPVPGDGKSTVAIELARALAASGSPTVLIDGDLRRPTVAKKTGLPEGAGLSDLLAGRAALSELLHRIPDAPNLQVLTAGTVPPNPSEILGSERMRQLLGQLSADATVILDSPPLLPVTDGAVLTHQADGALIVVTAGKTTFDLAGKAFEALANARGRALGVVINQAPTRGADASPYAHAYYTYYSNGDGKKAKGSGSSSQQSGSPSEAPAILDAPVADGAAFVDDVFPADTRPEPSGADLVGDSRRTRSRRR